MSKSLAIVVPVYQDEECIQPFLNAVREYVPTATVIFMADPDKNGVRRGQEPCILAGLVEAMAYDWIAIMDVDLQDPPFLLPEMIAKLEHGYDIAWPIHPTASGRSFLYRILSHIWYFIMVWRIPQIPRYANNFCMMNQATAKRVVESGIPWVRKAIALSARNGICIIPFHRPDRTIGESKYNFFGKDFADAVRKLFQ